MTLKGKLNKAEGLYHTKGKQYEAISLYKEILLEYPKQANAWFNLASLEFQIGNFDGCFAAYKEAQNIEPENIWFHHMYVTWLSLISSFDYEEPFFLDNNTKEAYKIETFKNKIHVLEILVKEIEKSLSWKTPGEKNYFESTKRLGMKYRILGDYEKSINYYLIALENIPKQLNEERSKKQSSLIYMNLAITYKSQKRWNDAKDSMIKAFNLGLSEYHNDLFEEIKKYAD